ncbi:MAG: T9SS type A sorting domain-containing protein [Candidatus Marinimicrobia bacterium]|jgi:aminopeptidase N|nr:T9SS type A sorting domain-containing protein [Candidatus Neomarinimicrobiota bacterium]MBT3577056.1 T9SS type A sorting domain-containing protein [Candidatus Neomarinimicrobiota bacterium]MBT3679938.1 T9SS type A sorting domain-containing protein [Candidatus Neomarinimicrobiota bacterium]MBT3949667.1 T9SS type A sorting domain-containing protein [Candidatus Neomarinimicrobiota bacterium]MBT4253182.1 T9SS type A sorting domain-containing protein [Candidatus Neomarinimicrobiota bacterium]
MKQIWTRQLLFLLGMIISIGGNAFIDEEKPCGHAHESQFLRDMQPTSEQEKIDIRYYGLNFDMDIATTSMVKEFLVRFVVLDTTVETIELDYSTNNLGTGNISVNTVILEGDTVAFTHLNEMLSIPLETTPSLGQLMTLEIFSQAGPASNQDNYGFNWDYESGQRSIWTKSQPYDARKWWPCIDYPRDKADSLDIVVTIADNMTVASNGRLISNIDNADGTRTWHYHVGYPIATYLVSLSIYDFYVWGDIYVDANNDTLPIEFYTYSHPDNPNPSYMTTNYGMLPDMLTLFADKFGPYPFMDEKYGHAEWGENWGLEHQTLTSMGNPTERRVAHELAHMWYGDMITCFSYHHIWLNEGFARYAEALWWEEHYGPSGYRSKMAELEYYGGGTIYVEDPETESIFGSNLSYNKPAWVLHMLRHIVGDETFFEILQTYSDDPQFKYGTATTEEFQMVCEEVSGLDFTNFFQQWIYGQGFPHYRAYRAQTGTDLLVQTIQSGLSFDLPVDFRITTTGSVIDTVLRIDQQFMTFNFDIPEGEIVTGLVMDPDGWILKSTDYVVGLAEDEMAIPLAFELEQNYPNPFNPTTTIPYTLDEQTAVKMSILNLQGREVIQLLNSSQDGGRYQVTWNGRDMDGNPVEAGVYLCRLETETRTAITKLLLVR